MTASPTVCVDIGNSGLRCVLYWPDPASQSDKFTAQKRPWSSDILRIDWPRSRTDNTLPSDSQPADSQPADSSPPDSQPALPLGALPDQLTDHLLRHISPWLTQAMQGVTGASIPQSMATRTPTVSSCRWLVSSVQRTVEAHLRQCAQQIGCAAYHQLQYQDVALEVAVDQPQRVGIDRLLAAHAALDLTADRPLIVIQAGSAITVDWLVAPRRFCGGAIMPGVPMMLRLLSQAADLLPAVAAEELLDLPPLPGSNTAAAMKAGACSAVVGGVQHLIARYRTSNHPAALVVLSGGDGPRLAAHLTGPILEIDHLVLRGIVSLARASYEKPIRQA